ncbi:MAG TPA: outer membrane beta-barrel protein [Chitinophagaceae bacterium]|nr:outer membrane beta-barrel protein [Chitinophagaceae bacterium]
MKKLFLAITIVTVSLTASAQKGNNQIGVGVDLGLPTSDFGDAAKFGFGGYLKGLYGIGSAGQITLTSGYTTYSAKDEVLTGSGADKIKYGIIPILAGYRHNFDGFYAEPQLGYSIFRAKMEGGGMSVSNSEGMFTWAVGLGYAMSGFDAGVRYQSGSKDGSTIAVVGIHIGYNFSLGGK